MHRPAQSEAVLGVSTSCKCFKISPATIRPSGANRSCGSPYARDGGYDSKMWTATGKGVSMKHPIAAEAWAAAARIGAAVHQTPVQASAWLSGAIGAPAFLKLETQQVTGSFKSRGACNKLLSLTDEELAKGIVTSSTGNHALAVLYACQQVSRVRQLAHPVQPRVFLPHNISTAKMDQLQQQGAHTVQHGTDCVEAELQAKAWAHQTGAVYISPYNDVQVAGGQGTIAIELLEQVQDLGTVYVPVGGGGLISGIAAVLKDADRSIRVVGCQPEASAVMMQSVQAGRIIEVPSLQTLSDGTAGGIEEGTITFEPCATLVDDWVVVNETDIAAAMVRVEAEHAIRIEGSAGVAVAAMQLDKHSGSKKARVAICCGSNVSASSWITARTLTGKM